MKEEYQEIWADESLEYFKRNYAGKDLYALEPNTFLKSIIEKSGLNIPKGGSVLEIGCGVGNNLIWLKKRFNVKACGTELNDELVDLLNKKIAGISFQCCHSHQLPYKKNSFDLVILRGVLSWVDRDYILQTIGEAIRVCKKYLIVSDFAPMNPYSVKYKHNKLLRTFKIDYQCVIESCRLMKLIFCEYANIGDDWKVIKTGLYQKTEIEEAYPEKEDRSLVQYEI